MLLLLFSPILVLVLIAWTLFANKYKALALIIVVIFFEKLFFITDLGVSSRLLSDVALALMLPIIFLRFGYLLRCINSQRKDYIWLILGFLLVVFLSVVISSHLHYGQPVDVGLLVARKYLLVISLFFAMALGLNQRDVLLFFKYLAYLGFAVSVLTILDVVLFGGGTIFSKYYAIGQTRGGLIRIHIATFLVVYSIIYFFVSTDFIRDGLRKTRYTLMMLIPLINLLFVIQTRAAIIGVVLVLGWFYVRNMNVNKLFISTLALSLFLLIVPFYWGSFISGGSQLGNLINLTLNEVGSSDGNIAIRQYAIEYLIGLTVEASPILGLGLFSDIYYPNNPLTIAAEESAYFLGDINGFSTFVNFGVLGVSILLLLTLRTFRDAGALVRSENKQEHLLASIVFCLLLFILLTPTLDNLLVENKLFYTGILIYFLGGYYRRDESCK